MKKTIAIFLSLLSLFLCLQLIFKSNRVPTSDVASKDTDAYDDFQAMGLNKKDSPESSETSATTADSPISDSHPSITDIPGVQVLGPNALPDNFANYVCFVDNLVAIDADAHRWATTIREQYATAEGDIENVKSVMLQDGDIYYHITQLTLKVQKHFFNTDGNDTVSLVHVSQYKKDILDNLYVITPYIPAEGYTISYDMGYYAESEKSGLCIYESAQNHTVTIQGITYDLSEYADYYLIAFMRRMKPSSQNSMQDYFTFGRHRASFFAKCLEDIDHEQCNQFEKK